MDDFSNCPLFGVGLVGSGHMQNAHSLEIKEQLDYLSLPMGLGDQEVVFRLSSHSWTDQ